MIIEIPSKKVEVPDGDVCLNWDGRSERNICPMLKVETDYIRASEAQASGLGYSAGSIEHYYCNAFNEYTDYEYGKGVLKLKKCKAS